MKNMDIRDIRAKQVVDVEDDKDQVLTSPTKQASQSQDDDQGASTSQHDNSSDQPSSSTQPPILQPTQVARDHPMDMIIGDIKKGVQTRSRLVNFYEHFSFVSSIEPTKIEDALKDADWINAIQDELNNFKRNDVWELVERP